MDSWEYILLLVVVLMVLEIGSRVGEIRKDIKELKVLLLNRFDAEQNEKGEQSIIRDL